MTNVEKETPFLYLMLPLLVAPEISLFFSHIKMLSAQPAYALARATFKRAQRGLFGGKHIQFGNNVMSNF